ncbi:MAG: hypothetical protein ACYC5Y_04550 [Symbiobacteriia bacterium]
MTGKHDEGHLDDLLRDTLAAEASRSAARAERGAARAWNAAQPRLQAMSAADQRGSAWRSSRWLLPAAAAALVAVVFFGIKPMLTAAPGGAPHPGANGPVYYGPVAGPMQGTGATELRHGTQMGADVGYYPPHIALAEPQQPPTGTAGLQGKGGRPAPVFRNTFRPTSDPFPPHVGQPVSFVSQPGWPGQRVWVYAAPAKEQETIMYDRLLPKDAILIGIVDIDQSDGHWTLANWTIPQQLSHGEMKLNDEVIPAATLSFDGPDTWFNVVAVTDTGYLAGSGLPLGPDRTLDVAPADVTVGQVLTIRGSGYPADERIRLDVLHDRPESQGGTDLEVTIGWARTDAGGRFSFDYKVPAELNWVFADNTGTMQDHRVTAGAPGTFSILAVEYEAGAEHGYATLEKRIGIQAAQ